MQNIKLGFSCFHTFSTTFSRNFMSFFNIISIE